MRLKLKNDFNPRSREGSDGGMMMDYKEAIEISIHAPAKGATLFSSR